MLLLLLLLSRLLSLLLVKMRLLMMMLLLMLLLLSMLTMLSDPVLVSPVVPPALSPSSCATPIAPTRVGSNEGVSRPVPHLLFPRHLHLPVRAQYHILKDFATQTCVGEQDALLDSERVGEVAGNVVVSILNLWKRHSMRTKLTLNHTTPCKVLVGRFTILHPKAIPRLS